MTQPTADPEGQSLAADAVLVGKLDADRVCQHCLHQLHGSLVHRDRRLGLLYVRCTECGAHAAVTEYPQSWKWLRRFSVVLAGAITLAAFMILVGDVIANTVGTMEASWDVTRPYADGLQALGAQRDPTASWIMSDELRADTAAIANVFADPLLEIQARWYMAVMLIPLTIIGLICGTLWSCMLMHRRIWWALALQLVPLTLAAIFAFITLKAQAPWGGGAWNYRDFVLYHVGWKYHLMAIGWLALVRVVATVIARPIIRMFFWVVVPKRVRLAVEGIWSDETLPG